MQEPKITNVKGGYTSNTSLIFLSWLKDTRIYVQERQCTQSGAVLLVKGFITDHARPQIETCLGPVVEQEKYMKDALHIWR